MTNIQARAIENARKEMVRARKELDRAQLHETRYRGVPTVLSSNTDSVHGLFTYRGVEYVK